MSAADLLQLRAEECDAIRHWSEHGQRGATPNRRIVPSDWPIIRPFIAPRTSEWSISIAVHQLPLLLEGFLPSESDSTSIQDMISNDLFQAGDLIMNHGYLSSSQENYSHVSEDKWFIYADGPSADGNITIHMHRSWTGQKALQISIQVDDNGLGMAEISSIMWETNTQLSDEDDELYAKNLALEVCEWVLSVDLTQSVSKDRQTPEKLLFLFERAMGRLQKSGPQTTMRTGQNVGHGARAYTQA
ncbi:hypothetical protein SVAN01_01678 [Stagonosporopsis vannaccii]|nr:hypothetical protein SVAN01_01678 [Stagonosporopsis vannaccii]